MSCCHGGMGIPFSVHCQCHGYGTGLIIYLVIGICHTERGGLMNLMKSSAQWESCRCRTAHVGE